MPPKRPPRRGKKYGLPGQPALAEVALKDIRRAHSLVERGDHANAAQLFERQARDAGDRGIYLSSAHLYLQAGRAKLLAGETKDGEYLLRQGMTILADHMDPRRLALSGNQLAADLLSMGRDHLAEELSSWLKQTLDAIQPVPVEIADNQPGQAWIPIQCPHCNAVLRPADIEREPQAVREVCVYCASLINNKEMF
jgi:hypothetical protein